jgi:hypothetical protein
VGLCQRAHPGSERSCEEVVEAAVAAQVRVDSLIHVDVVLADETADQPGRHGPTLRSGDAPGQSGHALLGHQVLKQDFGPVRHQGRGLIGRPFTRVS